MKFARNGANFDGEFPTLDKTPPLENGPTNVRVMCAGHYLKSVLTCIYSLVAQKCVKVLISS